MDTLDTVTAVLVMILVIAAILNPLHSCQEGSDRSDEGSS
jgi:hypothetical protein